MKNEQIPSVSDAAKGKAKQLFKNPDSKKSINKQEENNMNDMMLKDLNLLVLYLSGWEEDSRNNPGQKIYRSWKGYLFEVLNDFEEQELIIQNRKSKSVVFTAAGRRKAEEIKRKYF